jgi:hypothetical protein
MPLVKTLSIIRKIFAAADSAKDEAKPVVK